MRILHKLLFGFALLFLFTTCKKEIRSTDFEGSTGNHVKIFNIDSFYGVTPVAQFYRPDGGYLLVYAPGQTRTGHSYDVSGMVVLSADKDGNVLKTNYLGGTGTTNIWALKKDELGNVYLCGASNSKELRKDIWVDSVDVDKYCGYLAKVDLNANIIWQTTYSDESAPDKGIEREEFTGIEVINNKPICLSQNTNLDNASYPKKNTTVVSFDEKGAFVKQRYMPALIGPDTKNVFGSLIMAYWSDIIKITNNELLVRVVYFLDDYRLGNPADTGCFLLRYNPSTEQIIWQNFYRKGSPEYDLSYYGVLGNGNIAFFDYLYNKLNIIEPGTGKTVSTTTINNNTFRTNTFFNPLIANNPTIDGEVYFTGQVSPGSLLKGRKPFVIKLNSNGTLAYQKIFNFEEAGFNWVTKNPQGNLQYLGGINIFEKYSQKIFSISTDKNSNPISN